ARGARYVQGRDRRAAGAGRRGGRAASRRARSRRDAAREAGDRRRVDAARGVDVERGLVLLRATRLDEAAAAFRRAGDVPAARYWLAVTRAVRQGVDP